MKNIIAAVALILMISPTMVLAEVESWYVYWALGFANHNHPSEVDSYIDDAESIPGVDRAQFGIDAIGFYWPVIDKNTMAGFAISGSADSLRDKDDDYVQFNQYLFGASGMHFFGSEIGDGFFVRGDFGLASVITSSSFSVPNEIDKNDSGIGYLVGVGFSIPVSSDSRVMISFDFSSKFIDGDNYRTTTFKIGGLW
ncbi:outer membrane beta-barrel protein [Kaarinaea lacus]